MGIGLRLYWHRKQLEPPEHGPVRELPVHLRRRALRVQLRGPLPSPRAGPSATFQKYVHVDYFSPICSSNCVRIAGNSSKMPDAREFSSSFNVFGCLFFGQALFVFSEFTLKRKKKKKNTRQHRRIVGGVRLCSRQSRNTKFVEFVNAEMPNPRVRRARIAELATC